MTIGFPKSALFAQEGDELAVFDELGNIVGISKLTSENNYVVVWGDDEDLVEKSGMLSGEKCLPIMERNLLMRFLILSKLEGR